MGGAWLLAAFFFLPAAHALPIGRIVIDGPKTSPDVILRFLESREGSEFDQKKWNADVDRIRDTALFYDVSSESYEENGKQILGLHLKNKFSLIPILKFKSGGGTSLLTVGAYEANFMNRLVEVGGQYENLNGKNGAVFWFRHPYFLSWRNRVGADFYNRTVDLPLLTLTGEEEAFFDNKELRFNGRWMRTVTPYLRAGLILSLVRNNFEMDNSTPDRAAKNAAFTAKRPIRSGRTVSIRPRLTVGKLRDEGIHVRGQELELRGEWADPSLGSDFHFFKGEARWLSGYRPRPDVNVATQFAIGSKSGHEFQHKFYLGGLDSVRGFVDGQFRGEHMWLANVEVRPTLLNRPLWTLQGNVFTDIARTWDAKSFSSEGFKDPFLSFGVGFRVILPRVYRGILRFDLARTQKPVTGYGFNLGLQQFF